MHLETSKLLILSLVIVMLLLMSCESGTNPPQAGGPPTGPLPRSPKGYELYSWRAGQDWYFTLTTGTNRTKTYQEITSSENAIDKEWIKITVRGVHDLQIALEKLPPDTFVMWAGPQALTRRGVKPGDLQLPPRRPIEEVQEQCQASGVELVVNR